MSGDTRLGLAYVGDPNSIHVRRWMDWFVARGHRVTLLEGFGTPIGEGLDERIAVRRFRAGRSRIPGLGRLRSRFALRRVLAESGADLLHAHFVRRYGWLAAAAGFHPFVVSGWGSDVLVESIRTPTAVRNDRRTFAGADLITVTNAFMREAIVRNGAPRDRVALIQHGVDTARFSPGDPDPAFLARHGLEGRPIVLSHRAIRPLYRHESVLDAVARVPDDLLLVMSALEADPATLEAVRRRTAELGIAGRVRILDRIEPAELPDAYRAARVVVSVPESDSFPVTLLEALATGTPVVVGDLPPTRAVLAPIAPHALVPIGDAGAIAEGIIRTLRADEASRRRDAAALRRWVVREADYETNMRRMEELYRDLVSRR